MKKEKFYTGQEVLARDENTQEWTYVLFSHYRKGDIYPYATSRDPYKQCIPYKGNENLVGKTDSLKEDLPIDTPVMVCDNNSWHLRYYKTKNRCFFSGLKSKDTNRAHSWNYIVKLEDFIAENPFSSKMYYSKDDK